MSVRSLTLSIPAVLLKIGYLTTPTSSTGVSLSEFWAWVRYLAAVTPDADLRLTSAFANLDSHQKTILSDDFGMGVPMLWLTSALDLRMICDGRYFLQRFAAQAGASVRRTAKRGPNKTPDFVARDGRGVWHVIECKGTQSGSGYRAVQIGEPGPPRTGGIAQKHAISFPANHSGQRLVCGLALGVEDGGERTSLTIVDPELEDPIVISSDQLLFATDAAERATVARSLRLAGFDRTAETTAAPLGRFPWSRRDPRPRFDQARQTIVEEKLAAAKDELSRLDDRRSWQEDGARFRGRELQFDLPRPIEIEGKRVVRAVVRQGVNEDVLGELRGRAIVDQPLPEEDTEWADTIGTTVVDTDANFARLRIGRLFTSELLLKAEG